MRDRFIIVDDFYENPDMVVDMFKDLPTDDPVNNWAGVMSEMCLFDPNIKDYLSHLVGHRVDGGTGLNGRIRFSQSADEFKQDIHFDPAEGLCWAGIVYLSKDENVPNLKEAGTQFWKHKERGIESVPMSKEGLEEQGWNSFDDMLEFLETDGMDRSKWELQIEIPWKYNRLVLFRPWMFHSPGFPFGDSKDNCRTIQTFFLKFDDAYEDIDNGSSRVGEDDSSQEADTES